jgi:hypothetical protein
VSYILIVKTLYEFGLITKEQADEAIANYWIEYEAYEQRKASFYLEWKKRHPWWRRNEWFTAFARQEREE